ncbi:MAG TPA: mucoidy inhibitor MuiA family protein [Rhodoblastus sp.]|nr:mucoidy inhibitor MuiA family protein [Rhodoblastus sp.]
MRAALFPTLISALLAAPALARDIDADSRVDAVTLYPDAALVTRVADVDLPAGSTRLVFRALPAGLDPSSLRLAASGEPQLSLGALDVRNTAAASSESAFDTQLKGLRAERAEAQVKIDALAAKLAMIELYSRTRPDRLGDKTIKLEDWSAAWDLVAAAFTKTGEELREARAAGEAIDARIKALEAARPAPSPQGATRDVAVDVEASAPAKAHLALSYRVAAARWSPAYDARLTTGGGDGKPKLELIRRAVATQNTGEDWTDVVLSFAAFRATGAVSAPEVYPEIITFYEPPTPLGAGPEKAGPHRSPLAAAPAPTRAAARQAQLDANAYQASFVAPGRVSLASDGSEKNVTLSSQAPQAELSWRMAPALDPRAFLSVHYVNGEEAPLLPGPVAIYRDDALVGQDNLPLVAPHEAGDLGFGADDRVTVRRMPVKRKENEPSWFGQTKIETREFRTVVRNLHDFPIRAIVTDQAPYSENAAIVVELSPQTTAPDEKDPDGKRGLLRWRFGLAPGDSKEIILAYRMKWPADRDIVVGGP